MICGDHICVNKLEAKQYFEENLVLEVKVINNKKKNNIDLVELNLKNNSPEKKNITLVKKNKTRNKIKTLSNTEIKEIKTKIRQKKKIEIVKKNETKKKLNKLKVSSSKNDRTLINKKNNNYKGINEDFDICEHLEKCNIDEISAYLIKIGKKKGFPDITTRE